jgi:hypothetical protein
MPLIRFGYPFSFCAKRWHNKHREDSGESDPPLTNHLFSSRESTNCIETGFREGFHDYSGLPLQGLIGLLLPAVVQTGTAERQLVAHLHRLKVNPW